MVAKGVRVLLCAAILISFTLLSGCKDEEMTKVDQVDTSISHEKNVITTFSFTADHNPDLSEDINATINGTKISATVPNGTDVTDLIASFTHNGASVTSGGTSQISGFTPNDFSNDMHITVVGADGTTRDYTVATSFTPINIVFGPAITSMRFLRTADALMVTAVTNPESGLTYHWVGTGSFDNLDGTTNPVIISSFSDRHQGNITVNVVDSEGLRAQLSRTIKAGDYPYTISNSASVLESAINDFGGSH